MSCAKLPQRTFNICFVNQGQLVLLEILKTLSRNVDISRPLNNNV